MFLLFSLSVVSDSLRPHGLQQCQASLSSTISWSLLKLMSIESSPSPPALNLSQHQGLFQWVGFLHQVAKVLGLQLQHQSFQCIFRVDFLNAFLCVYKCIHIHCSWLFTTVHHLPQLLISHVHLFCDPMDCSLPGSSVLRISQAGILEWVAISFSRGSSQPRDWTWVSCIGTQVRNHWATREPHAYTYRNTCTHTHTHTHTSTIPGRVLGLGVLWQTGQTGSLFSSCRRRRHMGRNMVGRDGEVQITSGNMGQWIKVQSSSEILTQALKWSTVVSYIFKSAREYDLIKRDMTEHHCNSQINLRTLLSTSGPPCEVPGPAASTSSGSLLGMQILRPYPDLINQILLGCSVILCVLRSPLGDSNAWWGEEPLSWATSLGTLNSVQLGMILMPSHLWEHYCLSRAFTPTISWPTQLTAS